MSTPWWQLDWVWQATGWTLAAAGVVLFVWALFWDRARGRRRCPKCWYDLSGMTSRDRQGAALPHDTLCVCPECGRKIARERELGRTRRKWGWVVIALTAFLCAGIAGSVPQVQISGVYGFVPTTVLAIGVRWLERPSVADQQLWQSGSRLSLRQHLFMDLRRNRFDKGRIPPWQRRIMWSRMLSGDPDTREDFDRFWSQYPAYASLIAQDAATTDSQSRKLLRWALPYAFRVRDKWPAGVPIVLEARSSTYWEHARRGRVLRFRSPSGVFDFCTMGPAWWTDATNSAAWEYDLCQLPPHNVGEEVWVDLELLEFEMADWNSGDRSGKSVWSTRVRLPLEIVPREAIALKPVPLPDLTTALLKGETPWKSESRNGYTVTSKDPIGAVINLPEGTMSLRDATWKRLLNETVFAVHCEVRRGDQLAATGSGWVWMKNPGNNELGSAGLRGMRLEWRIPIPKYEEVSSDNTWSVRFMSDWEQALLCTVSESYWDGDVTCPTVRFAKWTRQGGGEIQPVDHHPWAYAPDAKQPGKPKK